MNIKQIQDHLREQDVTANEQEIRSAGVDLSEITKDTIDLLVEHFKAQNAPARSKRGGSLTKSQKANLATSEKADITAPAAPPVEQGQASSGVATAKAVFFDLQDQSTAEVVEYIRAGEDVRSSLKNTLVQYNKTFSSRLWEEVARQQQASQPQPSGVAAAAKQAWDEKLVEFQGALTGMGVVVEG
jgi:hypothetical protein